MRRAVQPVTYMAQLKFRVGIVLRGIQCGYKEHLAAASWRDPCAPAGRPRAEFYIRVIRIQVRRRKVAREPVDSRSRGLVDLEVRLRPAPRLKPRPEDDEERKRDYREYRGYYEDLN